MFNFEKFISAITEQNAEVLRSFFAPDAVIRWYDSNEQFTLTEYIRANCEYPGKWSAEIQRAEETKEGMVIVTRIFSKDFTTFACSFIKLIDGKITLLDEYYADYSTEIPKWRQKMNIGKPINN